MRGEWRNAKGRACKNLRSPTGLMQTVNALAALRSSLQGNWDRSRNQSKEAIAGVKVRDRSH